jgi:signal transduction histidine kinase
VSRDGAERPVDDSAAPIVDEAGQVHGVVLVFRDVTDRRLMERRREEALDREREARRRSEALNRAKDDFLSVLSHELRTPLTAIIGWTALIRAGRLDEETLRKAIEVIDRSVGVQLRLISDLLDVSSILAGKLTLDKRPVELWDTVQATIEVLRPAAELARVTLSVTGPGEAIVVDGDAQRLQQVVNNLVERRPT